MEKINNITGDTIVYLSYLLAILFLFHLLKFRNYFWITAYSISMLVIELTSTWYSDIYGNNLIFFHLMGIIEVTLCYLFIQPYIELKWHKFVSVITLIVLTSMILNWVLGGGIDVSMTLTSLIILSYCFLCFYKILGSELFSKIDFYFIISLFIIHSTSLILLLFSGIIFKMKLDNQFLLFAIRGIIYLIAKSILFYGLALETYYTFKNSNKYA